MWTSRRYLPVAITRRAFEVIGSGRLDDYLLTPEQESEMFFYECFPDSSPPDIYTRYRRLISDVLQLDWRFALRTLSDSCCEGLSVIRHFLVYGDGPGRVVQDYPAWRWVASILGAAGAGADETLDRTLAKGHCKALDVLELSSWRRSHQFGSHATLISGVYQERYPLGVQRISASDACARIIDSFCGDREPETLELVAEAASEAKAFVKDALACAKANRRVAGIRGDVAAECFLGFFGRARNEEYLKFIELGRDNAQAAAGRSERPRPDAITLISEDQDPDKGQYARGIVSRAPELIARGARVLPPQGQTRQPGSRRWP